MNKEPNDKDVQLRGFKGIWIPRDIWLDRNPTPTEKCLLVEIDSLDCDGKGCYASNKYLADFMQTTPATVGNMLTKLRKRCLVKTLSFDGRVRRIQSTYEKPDQVKPTGEPRLNLQVKPDLTHRLNIDTSNIEKNIAKDCELDARGTQSGETTQEDTGEGMKDSYSTQTNSGLRTNKKLPPIESVDTTDQAQQAVEFRATRRKQVKEKKRGGVDKVPSVPELSRMWTELVSKYYPEQAGTPLTIAQAKPLHNYAKFYCRQTKHHTEQGATPVSFEKFSNHMETYIRYWKSVIVSKLHWLPERPTDTPNVGLFCSSKLWYMFEAFTEDVERNKEYAGLTDREAYHLKHIHAGKTEAEAKRLTDRKFGTEEAVSEERILKLMNKMLQDLNYTIREDERSRKTRESKTKLDRLVEKHRKQYGKLSVEDQLEQLNKLVARPFQESEEVA